MIHVRQNYIKYDKKQIMKRLQSITGDEFRDLVTDSNGFNNFMADISKGVSVNQFGSGKFASNMTEAYKLIITVIKEENTAQTVKVVYSKVHSEVIGNGHHFAILSKNETDGKLNAPKEYPHKK